VGQKKPESFDRIRGVSAEVNANNKLNSFLPTSHEQPRLAVLQNFKEINKMIRANFMIGRQRRGLPADEITRREQEDEAARRLTNVMKKMCQVGRFQSPLKRAGEGAPSVVSSPGMPEGTPESPIHMQKYDESRASD